MDQDALTCGMVWLNQTSYARSTYRISSISNTASCAEDEEVCATRPPTALATYSRVYRSACC